MYIKAALRLRIPLLTIEIVVPRDLWQFEIRTMFLEEKAEIKESHYPSSPNSPDRPWSCPEISQEQLHCLIVASRTLTN